MCLNVANIFHLLTNSWTKNFLLFFASPRAFLFVRPCAAALLFFKLQFTWRCTVFFLSLSLVSTLQWNALATHIHTHITWNRNLHRKHLLYVAHVHTPQLYTQPTTIIIRKCKKCSTLCRLLNASMNDYVEVRMTYQSFNVYGVYHTLEKPSLKL